VVKGIRFARLTMRRRGSAQWIAAITAPPGQHRPLRNDRRDSINPPHSAGHN
jgi:hypothetical protein